MTDSNNQYKKRKEEVTKIEEKNCEFAQSGLRKKEKERSKQLGAKCAS